MKIEFLEHDGMLQEDGLPKIVIVSVDGVKFPYETGKTIVDLYRDAEKIKTKAPAVVTREPQRPIEVRPGTTIQRNDTVKFLGALVDGVRTAPEDNADLVKDGLYKVIETSKDTVAIINPDSDFPIRLTVKKSDVELVQKGERVTQKLENYEVIRVCTCGQPMALERKGEEYQGTCASCKEPMTIARQEALK